MLLRRACLSDLTALSLAVAAQAAPLATFTLDTVQQAGGDCQHVVDRWLR